MRLLFFSACYLLFFGLSISSFAQQKDLPTWVAMIDNPTTNYFEAIKTFDDYWKDKTIWDEEEEMFEIRKEGKEERDEERKIERFKKQLKRMTPAQRQEFDAIKYHYKRFKTWAFEVKAFVQEDGHILTQEERMAIWEQQQKEMKK